MSDTSYIVGFVKNAKNNFVLVVNRANLGVAKNDDEGQRKIYVNSDHATSIGKMALFMNANPILMLYNKSHSI